MVAIQAADTAFEIRQRGTETHRGQRRNQGCIGVKQETRLIAGLQFPQHGAGHRTRYLERPATAVDFHSSQNQRRRRFAPARFFTAQFDIDSPGETSSRLERQRQRPARWLADQDPAESGNRMLEPAQGSTVSHQRPARLVESRGVTLLYRACRLAETEEKCARQ